MLSDLFYWLFNMSISASIAGLLILLAGKLRRMPRRLLHLLWVIPLLRMWIPIGINSKYSLLNLFIPLPIRSVLIAEGTFSVSMLNFTGAADTYFPITYKLGLLKTVFQTAAVIWLIVASALLLTMLLLYRMTKSELKDARHLRNNLYFSDKVTAPAVYGIFRERIILPEEYVKKDLTFLLLHENAHIKRKDNLWRILAIATACVHWFNPFAWLFLKSFLTNLELACDEAVLSQCGEGEKKRYAAALLDCAESKSLYASAFGGAKMRLRIDRILSYKKLSVFSIICLVILSAVIGYVLLTNAM